MKKSVVIAGAGISGISLSRMLSPHMHVTVLEKATKAGGLIRCDRIDGALFHRVGGHVFNSKNIEVLDWFWKHFDKDKEFIKAIRNAKIWLHEKQIGYPIENFLYQLPDDIVKNVVNELADKMADPVQQVPDNFRDFLIGRFGKTLFDLYFGPYNQKIWNTALEKVRGIL